MSMEGYAKLAAFMSQQKESAQVLHFSDIALQNILYLQAEIYGLRQDLRSLEFRDKQTSQPDDHKQFSFDWHTLATTPGLNGKPNEQWRKVLQLRGLLKEYHEAVLQYNQMSALPAPKPHDLKALQEWMRRPSLGAVYLTGRDRSIWANGTDLVSIGHRTRPSYVAAWISRSLIPVCHRIFNRLFARKGSGSVSDYGDIVEYSMDTVTKATSLAGAVLASLLPVLAIVVLHLVHGMGIRLGLVMVFSALFSVSVWSLGDGKLGDVFSATAAFAAVQVVFIATN